MIQIPASNQTQKHMWQCGPVSPILLPTPVVNFINILRTIFSYPRRFSSFFYVHVTRENDVHTKICTSNVDEIDTYKTNSFWVQLFQATKAVKFFKNQFEAVLKQ